MKNKTKNKQKNLKLGFTLLELLVVVLIIGILAAIALPQYKMATLKAKYARAKQTASDIKKAYEFYYTIHNEFPTKFSELGFANKFDDSSSITTSGGYTCRFDNKYHAISCDITKLSYVINFYTYFTTKITTQCQAKTTDTSDIYNKLCQQETGKIAAEAKCVGTSYCYYLY